jgi:hypothetical protein
VCPIEKSHQYGWVRFWIIGKVAGDQSAKYAIAIRKCAGLNQIFAMIGRLEIPSVG